MTVDRPLSLPEMAGKAAAFRPQNDCLDMQTALSATFTRKKSHENPVPFTAVN
jgi:hypothetical protein